MAGQGQSCSNKEGLNTDWITDCMGKGQKVQCPNNGKAPLSPEILTCGKLGSYSLDSWYQLPPAIMCGGLYCALTCIERDKHTLPITLSLCLHLSVWLPACPPVCLSDHVCQLGVFFALEVAVDSKFNIMVSAYQHHC